MYEIDAGSRSVDFVLVASVDVKGSVRSLGAVPNAAAISAVVGGGDPIAQRGAAGAAAPAVPATETTNKNASTAGAATAKPPAKKTTSAAAIALYVVLGFVALVLILVGIAYVFGVRGGRTAATVPKRP